ncbi:MAG: protein kinase [bacterium]
MIGKTISHYKILERLGSGGMGTVYKARDTKLDRFVALKFLLSHLGKADEEKNRFMQEAKAASALDHPNICTIHEIDETPTLIDPTTNRESRGQMFIAMAYYHGESLKEKIDGGPIAIEAAVDIAIKVAEGLGRAHEEKIVHRDIKPANIMITHRDEVKIVDFGLAKLAGVTQLTKEGTTLGTVAYMSPEQAQGAGVDHRTDIWALGAVLYETVSGQQPFKGDNDLVVMYSIVNEAQAQIRELRDDIPTELQQIIDKALAKDRNDRYQSLDEMIKDLKSLTRRKGDSKRVKPTAVRRLRMSRKMFVSGVAAFLVLLTLAGIYRYLTRVLETYEGTVSHRHRIAVLPFVNISQDPDDEYFTDGMTEELISTLSRISELRVLARTSVMRYKNSKKSIAEIGQELQVGTVLEGSVRHAAHRLRINVKLVDTRSQELLWSQDYNREFKDVFAVQSEIAKQLAEALRISLATAEKQQIDKKTTENLEAYTLYLRARYEWNKLSLDKALEYYQRAIEKDPDYAQAYAGLAHVYGALGYQGRLSHDEAGSRMKTAALKAIDIDETLGEAYTSLAGYEALYDWDWSASEKLYSQAISLNPNDPQAHIFYGNLLEWQGRHDESLGAKKTALLLDPLSERKHTQIGDSYFYMGQYDEAIEQYRKTLESAPNHWRAHMGLGRCFEQKGRIEEAIKAYQQSRAKWELGCIYALSGRESEARQIISEIKQSKRNSFYPYNIAAIYLALGDKEQAFQWLEKAYELHSMGLLTIKIDRRFRDVRQAPRYLGLLKRMGLEK